MRVVVSNAFFFLFKDGTFISIHQGDRSFGNQIYHRLRHADTVLRKDAEASLLLQALLDLIVDQAIQVVDKYSDKINETETQVLLKPNMNIVRTREQWPGFPLRFPILSINSAYPFRRSHDQEADDAAIETDDMGAQKV